ncbi:ROK family transcriptional regulator [Catenulispora subtropica]|uniref:ROK family transcriptional regulator n=1 Tax=Catenulispora subtropica TaxID=450798 RepID=A0ABP5DZT0_9ACTN
MTHSATSRDLRQRNRAAVFRRMVLDGETTRADLAAACGMSAATVTNVVNDLIGEGLVRELGFVPSVGGRPIARLGVVPDGAHVVGADFGEEWVAVKLFDLSLRRHDEVRVELDRRTVTGEVVAAAIREALDRFRAAHPERMASLVGIGLGLPGIVEHSADGSSTLFAQTLRWRHLSIDTVFDLGDVPVFADNVAKTLTIAEHWLGAARGSAEAAVVLVGRGIGAGFVNGGRVLQGLSGSAGEWGHTKISIGGPSCQCGSRGCLEAHVGGDAIVRRWLPDEDELAFTGTHGVDRFLAAVADDDPRAVRILDDSIEVLGLGLANLVNMLNPERIVVGGWLGQRLMAVRGAELERAVRAYSLARPGQQVAVVPCQLGEDAIATGSALLPLERLIDGELRAPQPAERGHAATRVARQRNTKD